MARSATAAMRLLGPWLSLLLVGLVATPTLWGHATKPMPRVSVTGKVLLGDPKSFRAVATIDRRLLMEAIPAYRALRTEAVARHSARYHFLIYEANRELQRVVAVAAGREGVDLVVETGGVAVAGIDLVDLTGSALLVLKQPEKTR
jgi:hypothetical protein